MLGSSNQAPYDPRELVCSTSVAPLVTETCTLNPASPLDPEGDVITYQDAGSTCAGAVIDPFTGSFTFTTPARGNTCSIKVSAYDGRLSSGVVSATITVPNQAPAAPASVSCASTIVAGSLNQTCTLTAATPVDADGDQVTYLNAESTCPATSVHSITGVATFTAPAKGASCLIRIKANDGAADSSVTSSSAIVGTNNAPSTPTALSCPASPGGGSSGQSCTLTAASPPDLDSSDTITYVDDGSTCASPSITSTTGAATFTAPAQGASCVMRVKAYDGSVYSAAVSSVTITGGNNAPAVPASLACTTAPAGGATAQTCTMTAAATPDADGDSVTYVDGGSTCASPSFTAATGAATFTAPAKGATCVMRVRAYDGTAHSSAVSSATITGGNNAPFSPASLSCTSGAQGSTNNPCTLTAASPLDPDGDAVTYSNDNSTCASVSVTSSTGNATFTAPASGQTCNIRIRAYDGTAYSTAVADTVGGPNTPPAAPASLSCTTAPAGGATAQTCTMTAAATPDADGDSVTYVDDGSTCASPSFTASTGAATFTAPAKGATCVMKVKAYDGADYSSAVSSSTITGGNNAPATPGTFSCTASPAGGATAQACTLTAAATPDADGDSVTYVDDGSTCASPSITSSTGAATFTAPAKGSTCVMKVKAYDTTAYSSIVTSNTITGGNNAPATPASLSCTASPAGGATAQACTLTAAATPDADTGDTVTYVNDGSTCGSPSVTSSTGAATFTAPAKGATCVMKVKAYDNTAYSSIVTSNTITGGNNTPAPPASLTCTGSPLAGATAQTCTMTAAATPDEDTGDTITYVDGGSTCASPSITASTGAATFTAPAKGATCLMRVRADDGTAQSSVIASNTITGQNNAPNAPTLSCPTTPIGSSTGNVCTLTAASPLDADGDAITYTDGGSTCPAFSIDSSTGATTFTAPATASTCLMRVRTFDGTAYSSIASSATLTGTAQSLNAATSLGWSQTTPTNQTSVTAAWTVSSSSGTTGQKIQYYTGSNCDTTNGSLTDLASASTATHAFSGVAGTTYTYKITTADAQGSIESACSSALVIDTCVLGPSAIAAGGSHTCTLLDGALRCWGANTNGRLGDGTTTQRTTPIMVSGLTSEVTAFTSGFSHSCAIESGALYVVGERTQTVDSEMARRQIGRLR